MTSNKPWYEELLDLANREYYIKHIQQPQRRSKVTVPDLNNNEFWDQGETTK